MNLDEMNLEQVIARIAELDTEVRSMTKAEDVDKAAEEKRGLVERKAELEALEQRKQTALNITAGKVSVIPIEVRKDTKMEEKRTFGIETVEYREAFFKNLLGRPLDAEERTAVSAASVIPTTTWDKIVEKMEYISPIISKVTLTQIPSNLTIPVEDTTNDAAWVAMGTAATDGADSTTSVSIAAYKLIKTVEIGADLTAMSIDQFEAYIVNKLYKKIAKAVEAGIITGSGSGQATGLLKSGLITNTGTFTKAAMTYADLLKIIADLPDHGYRENACFIMPSALFYSDVLPALTDKGSGLDVQAVEKNKVLKYDVILCDRVTADTIIFGDLSYYHFNWASPVEVKADASVGFRTGSTVYRAMGLADGKPTTIDAFNVYTRAAS